MIDSRFGDTDLATWDIAPPKKPDNAAAFSLSCCGGGHFAAQDIPAWVRRAIAAHAKTLRALVRLIARPFAGKLPATHEATRAVTDNVRETIVDAMAAADLEGRAEILDEAGVEPEPLGPIDEGGTGTVPHVPFGEAVIDMVKRHPKLANNAAAVAKLYRDGPAFAMAKSVELNVTEHVKGVVSGMLKDGADTALTIKQIADQSEDFTRAYAETVLTTNVNTAQTAGLFEQVKDPEVRKVIVAFQVSVTKDRNLRRGRKEDNGENHAAAHGLIAGVDDPIWQRFATPYGYRCRCRLIRKTVHQLRRLGLLKEDGTVTRRLPPGLSNFRRHPNFTRSRPPGL